ncbi:MAG TPA: 50S ribosomal protein L10 [Gemmataceae bacterium]|nr:50S ribosomal protein L10 [Gemmataceae bacterium]
MSKAIKQMQMDALKITFGSVQDFVLLSITGLTAQQENGLRHTLRKKKVRLLQVKNSLARLALDDVGVKIGKDSPYWVGSTTFAWGTSSAGSLARTIEEQLKNQKTAAQYKDKVKVKGGIAEGQLVPFDLMVKMPTREEALASVLGAILGPASQVAGCLTGPAAQVASQIKTISEKKEEEAAPVAATA